VIAKGIAGKAGRVPVPLSDDFTWKSSANLRRYRSWPYTCRRTGGTAA